MLYVSLKLQYRPLRLNMCEVRAVALSRTHTSSADEEGKTNGDAVALDFGGGGVFSIGVERSSECSWKVPGAEGTTGDDGFNRGGYGSCAPEPAVLCICKSYNHGFSTLPLARTLY